MKDFEIKIGSEFRPSPQLRKLYYVYLAFVIIFGVLTWYIPLLLFAPFGVTLAVSIPILAFLIFVMYWIERYCKTMLYRLTRDEITWRRGVWFKNTGIVPYNRITNIDITQGPVSRALGIADLKIQTAGYSGPKTSAEIRIVGVEYFEELRDTIMKMVKGKKPTAAGTYEEKDTESKILDELIKIRKLLEKSQIKK